MMRPDSIAREPDVFGNDFVDHYGGTREHEVKLWNEAVTNWECRFLVYVRCLNIMLIVTIVERYLELA
jgi:glutamine synthetase